MLILKPRRPHGASQMSNYFSKNIQLHSNILMRYTFHSRVPSIISREYRFMLTDFSSTRIKKNKIGNSFWSNCCMSLWILKLI